MWNILIGAASLRRLIRLDDFKEAAGGIFMLVTTIALLLLPLVALVGLVRILLLLIGL